MNRPIKPVANLCFKISHWEESLGVWAAVERSYPGLAISWICGGGDWPMPNMGLEDLMPGGEGACTGTTPARKSPRTCSTNLEVASTV